MRYLLSLLILLALLFIPGLMPSLSVGQVACFGYSGGMLSCDSPRGNTLITPLTPSQGIIQSERGAEPYTILPPSSREPRRDSYSSRPSEPLERLDRLDRLDRFERDLDPFLAPLVLGE